MLPVLMKDVRMPRRGGGRPRTNPDRLRGDQAESSRGNPRPSACLGDHSGNPIPEPDDQIGHRNRRGSRSGLLQAFDAADYKGRNVIEREINTLKQWRGLATR
jgi:putative transposase